MLYKIEDTVIKNGHWPIKGKMEQEWFDVIGWVDFLLFWDFDILEIIQAIPIEFVI